MQFLAPVSTLLLAIFLLMAGSGALPALLGLRLDMAGHSAPVIGAVSASYFAGLTVGSLRVLSVIRRVGHIRAFAAFVSAYSASAIAYSAIDNIMLWALLRAADGFCVAGIFMCLESWLNDRADPEKRGSTLAFYMIALYAGQAVAQSALGLPADKPHLPFMLAAIILSLTVVPIALTKMAGPVMDDQKLFSLKRLYAISPLALVGAAVTGVMLGAFYGMGAVQAQRLGLNSATIASLLSGVIIGGMALQWPLGRLSDLFDRRKVIVLSFAATALVCLGMALFPQPAIFLPLGMAFGGFSFALYPLCVSHANDHIEADERMGASGGLILCYSVGAAIGPLVGAGAMMGIGPSGLYFFIALCALVAFGFGLWRQYAAAPVPAEEQNDFQILPRTTPMAAALDPQVHGDEDEDPARN